MPEGTEVLILVPHVLCKVNLSFISNFFFLKHTLFHISVEE